MTEIKEKIIVLGKVKAVRKDGKGFLLIKEDNSEQWCSNQFLQEEVGCAKGDSVKAMLSSKGYLETVEVIETAPQEEAISPAAPIKTSGYVGRTNDTEASIVSQVIIKSTSRMVAGGIVKLKDFEEVTKRLTEIYKNTKKLLI